MRHTVKFAGFALLIALIIAACNMGFGTSARDVAAPPAGAEPQEPLTGAAVSIPTVSTRLLSALNANYSPSGGELGAQAILFATRVDLALYQDGGAEPIETWSISEDDGLTTFEDGPPRLETFLEIVAGSGYTLTAAVFNAKADSENPVVAGSSEEFSVIAGTNTPVSIVAVPVDPILFDADGAGVSLSIVQTPYEFDTDDGFDIIFTGIGGEAWFELALEGAEDRFGRIIADPGGSADAVLLLYDDEGRMFEGVNEPPPWSWGFFPNALGGRGGTRAAFMGDLFAAQNAFMGAVLLNRDELTSAADLALRLDFLERPQPAEPYPNALPASVEPDLEDFLDLPVGEEITQIIFEDDTDGRMVHWFLLDGIGWGEDGLMDPLPVTVTITLDVLESDHVIGVEGGLDEENGENGELENLLEDIRLVLLAGNATLDIYVALDDPEFEVTENADGSTTLRFTADVITEGRDVAAIAVSSRFGGNQFTLSWNAPGGMMVGIE